MKLGLLWAWVGCQAVWVNKIVVYPIVMQVKIMSQNNKTIYAWGWTHAFLAYSEPNRHCAKNSDTTHCRRFIAFLKKFIHAFEEIHIYAHYHHMVWMLLPCDGKIPRVSNLWAIPVQGVWPAETKLFLNIYCDQAQTETKFWSSFLSSIRINIIRIFV